GDHGRQLADLPVTQVRNLPVDRATKGPGELVAAPIVGLLVDPPPRFRCSATTRASRATPATSQTRGANRPGVGDSTGWSTPTARQRLCLRRGDQLLPAQPGRRQPGRLRPGRQPGPNPLRTALQ